MTEDQPQGQDKPSRPGKFAFLRSRKVRFRMIVIFMLTMHVTRAVTSLVQ